VQLGKVSLLGAGQHGGLSLSRPFSQAQSPARTPRVGDRQGRAGDAAEQAEQTCLVSASLDLPIETMIEVKTLVIS
jgi:hypothetical protein